MVLERAKKVRLAITRLSPLVRKTLRGLVEDPFISRHIETRRNGAVFIKGTEYPVGPLIRCILDCSFDRRVVLEQFYPDLSKVHLEAAIRWASLNERRLNRMLSQRRQVFIPLIILD